MEHIATTLHNINAGFTATDEAQILPIYQDGELLNGAAYAAYRFKRLVNATREHAGQLALQTANAAGAVVNHMGAEFPEW